MIVELFIFLLSLFLFLPLYKMYTRRLKLPPGPCPWPFVGNLYQLDFEKPQNSCYEWSKIYGPVITVWFAHEPVVMVTDYEVMKNAFVGEQLASRPRQFHLTYLTNGRGLGVTYGELFKEQSRFFLQTVRDLGNVMEEKASKQVESMCTFILDDMGTRDQIEIDMTRPLTLCVGNILATALFGQTFDKNDEGLYHFAKTLAESFETFGSRLVLILNSFPWLRHLPVLGHFGFDDLCRQTDIVSNFVVQGVEECKKRLERNENEFADYSTMYLREIKRRQKEGNQSYFNEEQLLATTADLFAGIEPTVSTLRWAMLAMANHPDIQSKVQEEIDGVIGRKRMPTMIDRQSMPYTMATINEIQRWGSIVGMNLVHSNDIDFQLSDFTIPKQTHVIPQIANVFIDENIFPRADEFDPDRFLEDDRKSVAKIPQLVPFSVGKFKCVGEGLARMMLFLIFVHLMQRFQFSTPEGVKKIGTERNWGLSSSPLPFKCSIRKRY